MAYLLGQAVRISTGTISGPTGPADPATLTLTITLPDGTTTILLITDLTRESLGVYHYDYLPAMAGDFAWRFVATVPNAAAEGKFTVNPAGPRRYMSGYMTVAEFRAMPTRLAVDQLVINATANMQDAELAAILVRSSAWADTFCQSTIGAKPVTLLRQVKTTLAGDAHIAAGVGPKIPVLVSSVAWGALRTALTSLSDITATYADRGLITVGIGGYTGVWSGALQFGSAAPGQKVWVSLGLVTGWANTILTVDQNAADTSVTVADPTGIVAGQTLWATNPGAEEPLTVLTVAGPVITLTTGLRNAQTAGCGLTAIPSDIREAVAYAACARIVTPGTQAETPFVQAASKTKNSKPEDMSYQGQAESLLGPYRRQLP